MFYELIYTRCRQGIDITKKGQQITIDGFKVYSCSPAIMEEGKVDITYLANVAQVKQQFTEPGFMEDAYLYFTPDTGAGFFVNFFPIPWQRDYPTEGKFLNRPEAVLNHIFAGDFAAAEFYPYEMFGSPEWNAKTKLSEQYAYYYETPPKPLGMRKLSPHSRYSFSDISAFIADGRREALKQVVAFLFSQYELPPHERKYLVIRDENTGNIELWIAAISCAFSPRIAAGLPFATRMNQFQTKNMYKTDQGLHHRAIIVGVDERDRGNAGAARPMANSKFVLLEGREKRISWDAFVTTHPYYEAITSFSEEHHDFCRNFLQMFAITTLCKDVLALWEPFTVIHRAATQRADVLLGALKQLKPYSVACVASYQSMCTGIEKELPRLLNTDIPSALELIAWLQGATRITEDSGLHKRLVGELQVAFDTLLFADAKVSEVANLWHKLKGGYFEIDIAQVITNQQKLSPLLERLGANDWVIFTDLYLSCADCLGNVLAEDIQKLLIIAIPASYRLDRSGRATNELVGLIAQRPELETARLLLTLARDTQDGDFAEFLVRCILAHDLRFTSSDRGLISFCESLSGVGLQRMAPEATEQRLKRLTSPAEYMNFIDTLESLLAKQYLAEKRFAQFISEIDQKIQTTDRSMAQLALRLLERASPAVPCIKSVHLHVFDAIKHNPLPQSFMDILRSAQGRGFPSITEPQYVGQLASGLLSVECSQKEWEHIAAILTQPPTHQVYFTTYFATLVNNLRTHSRKWPVLMAYVASYDLPHIDALLVNLLISMDNEKLLNTLEKLLVEGSAEDAYFQGIVMEVLSSINPKSAKKRKKHMPERSEIQPNNRENSNKNVSASKKEKGGFWGSRKK